MYIWIEHRLQSIAQLVGSLVEMTIWHSPLVSKTKISMVMRRKIVVYDIFDLNS